METLTYRISIEPDDETGYIVTVPALPGCVTWGKDLNHALEMAKEAIEGYIESLRIDGEPIPPPDSISQSTSALIQVSVKTAA